MIAIGFPTEVSVSVFRLNQMASGSMICQRTSVNDHQGTKSFWNCPYFRCTCLLGEVSELSKTEVQEESWSKTLNFHQLILKCIRLSDGCCFRNTHR